MIERYYRYETAKLLQEYNHNKDTLKSLREQYKALDGTTAIDYSLEKVGGTPAADGLENIALRRVDLKKKIGEYEHDLKLIDECLEKLTERERDTLKEFYMVSQSKTDASLNISELYGIEHTAVYNLRRRALNRFETLLFG